MAAFSSLALLGLGLAGGFAASRALGGRQAQQPAAQGTTQASATPDQLAPSSPPSATETTSTATAQARQAGQRQRRRAAPVSRTQPVRQNPPALLEPLSLLGRL